MLDKGREWDAKYCRRCKGEGFYYYSYRSFELYSAKGEAKRKHKFAYYDDDGHTYPTLTHDWNNPEDEKDDSSDEVSSDEDSSDEDNSDVVSSNEEKSYKEDSDREGSNVND